MNTKKLLLIATLSCSFVPLSYADNGVAAAVAASVATQAVNTGSATYMQKNGMQPQYVSTPTGTYVVPTANNNAPKPVTQPVAAPAPTTYDLQNQQQNKVKFINGNVVQAFPDLPPAATAGN
jgi:hypothetical protein